MSKDRKGGYEWLEEATDLSKSSRSSGKQKSFLSQGSSVGEADRKIGVTEQTYYRWRREYGEMRIEQVKRLRRPLRRRILG